MIENEETNSFSEKLKMMQSYYRQKLQVQKGIQDQRNQKQTKAQQQQSEVIHKINQYSNYPLEQDTNNENDAIMIQENNLRRFNYYELLDKIKETEVDFHLSLPTNAIHLLDQILAASKVSMQYEQQKLLYVEVLQLCNRHAAKYIETISELPIASLLLQKCDMWTHTYDLEPFMRVLTLLNLGVCYKKQGRISQSLDVFQECLKIILEKKYFTKIAEIYLNLAQLYSQIGQHDKALDNARKALQSFQSDFLSINSPDVPKSHRSFDQCFQRRNTNEQIIQTQRSQKSQERKNTDVEDIKIGNNFNPNQHKQIKSNADNFAKQNKQNLSKQNEQNQKKQNNLDLCNLELEVKESEWTSNKLSNLILCYETLANEEEHLLNFEEAGRLHTKAVAIVQKNLGIENQISVQQLNKLLNFKKRQADFSNKKQKNMIHAFSHLSIKRLLENQLNENTIKINQLISQQQIERRTTSPCNLFSNKKVQSNMLLNSPYNQVLFNNQPLSTRQKSAVRSGSQQCSRKSKVVVIRQKKLNLDTVPSSLKFNITNGTNGTAQTSFSIISGSTDTTKHLGDRKQRYFTFTNKNNIQKTHSSYDERISTQEENLQLRNLLSSPIDQQINKGSLTQRSQDCSCNFQFRENQNMQNNTSYLNDAFQFIYPSPRLKSGRELQLTMKQRNPSPNNNHHHPYNSDRLETMIENKISEQNQNKQQCSQNRIQLKKQSASQNKVLATSQLSSPSNTLTNYKSHLQSFVDQMKIKRDQVNQQFQQMNVQYKMSQPASPFAQIFGDTTRRLQSGNGSKKALIYSDIKVVKGNLLNNHQDISNKIENRASYLRKKAFSTHEQPQICDKQTQINNDEYNQQQMQLLQQSKFKLEEMTSNYNNMDQNTTAGTVLAYSNSTSTIQPTSTNQQLIKERLADFKRKHSYSTVQKVHTNENIQKLFLERKVKSEAEKLLEVKESEIKILISQDEQQCNTFNEQSPSNVIFGCTKFLFNKSTMILTIIFQEYSNQQKVGETIQRQLTSDNNQFPIYNNSLPDTIKIYKHIINVSDLFTLNKPININKTNILQELCKKIYSLLYFDKRIKQLAIQIVNNDSSLNQNHTFGFPKIIEFPNEGIQIQLVQKDQKSSIIYCQENNGIKSQMKIGGSQPCENNPQTNSPQNKSKQIEMYVCNNDLSKENSIHQQVIHQLIQRENMNNQFNATVEQNQLSYIIQIKKPNEENLNQTQLINKPSDIITKSKENISRQNEYDVSQRSQKQQQNDPTYQPIQSQQLDNNKLKQEQFKPELSKKGEQSNQVPIIKEEGNIQMLDGQVNKPLIIKQSQDQNCKLSNDEREENKIKFDLKKRIEEQIESKSISLGSVKFISYYQVNSQNSSHNSITQLKSDESNTLRNSSGFQAIQK